MRSPLKSVLSLLLLAPLAHAQKIAVGILPVYDATAEPLTETLPPSMTFMLYKHMSTVPGVQPFLLSPGGLYDTAADDYNREYGRRAHVDVLLITRLLPSIKTKGRKIRMVFEVRLLDVASGKAAAPAVNDTIELAPEDLLDSLGSNLGSVYTTYKIFRPNSSDFEKQPLGKAALKLVDWTDGVVQTTAPTIASAPTAAPLPATAPCKITFRVRYNSKHTSSKSYSVLVDDEDESSTIQEGLATFSIPGGPITFRVHTNDEPYRLPTEKLYQISSINDCSAPTHAAVMEIGAAGEAFIRWE
jgi:hypothetical protein